MKNPINRNLLKRNKHRTGALLSPIRASHFGIKNQPKFHVFAGIVFGNPFSHFFNLLCQKCRFYVHLGIHLGPKWRPKSNFSPKMAPFSRTCGRPRVVLEATGATAAARSAQGIIFRDFHAFWLHFS